MNPALIGDYFPTDPAPGFANMKLWDGLTKSLLFFLPDLPADALLGLLFGFTVLSAIGHFYAQYRLAAEKAQ